jgi:hypothetical protein
MNLVIPPLVFYAVGAALVIGGTVRTLTLGRRNPEREISDDDPARTRARRRHFTFGLIWVAMGLFLIVSTVGVLRSKWGNSDPASPGASAKARRSDPASPSLRLLPSETIRLDSASPTTEGPPAKR